MDDLISPSPREPFTRPVEVWCALGAEASDVERVEPDGTVRALCYRHAVVGPCDDCYQWVGHNPAVEH